ncbi:hypothetical protein [Endozoicomonas sp. ALD040]|uniref:hypothetical protein n=1 Tax=Endozoicomonas sp. ALD040 TaxID=3403079 RepID=UPI003BB0A48E
MKPAIFILIVAWIVSVIALITDLLGYTASMTLFGRTGAVLTLFAVVLEYKISTKGQKNTSHKPDGRISLGAVGNAVLLTDGEKCAQYFAHISVILGTFIWGFGDLVLRFTNTCQVIPC